jgi:Fur family transcriptional regulator, ferric uptake regulator
MSKPAQTPLSMLRAAGLRRTPMRIGVLDILTKEKQTLTAPQILERLAEGSDTVTLYRTLQTFTEKKLVHRVRGDDQAWRYGMGDSRHSTRHGHAHFVCEDCGTVECLDESPTPQPPRTQTKIPSGYRVAYSEVVVHGTCSDCHR